MHQLLRRRHAAAVIAVLCLALAPTAASAGDCPGADLLPGKSNPGDYGVATLCLVNEEREQHRRRPLRPNGQLGSAAQAHADAMVAGGFFAHRWPNGVSVTDRVAHFGRMSRWAMLGENLGTGTLSLATPRAMVEGWMGSDSHRATMLTRRFTHLGVGVVFGLPATASRVDAATYATAFGYAERSRRTRARARR